VWCDTKWANENPKEMSIEKIIEEIEKLNVKSIIITGSEPLMAKDNLIVLCKILKEKDIANASG
jgi:organic radical activating enzyme